MATQTGKTRSNEEQQYVDLETEGLRAYRREQETKRRLETLPGDVEDLRRRVEGLERLVKAMIDGRAIVRPGA